MKRLSTVVFAAVALALVAGVASAKEWKKIRIGVEGAYPPFSWVEPDGTLKGFDIDITNALCKEIGAECNLVQQDWDGIIPALLARKYDAIIASMSITEERKKKVAFTDKYYNTPAKFVRRKGSGIEINKASMKGKAVGVQRATTHDNFITGEFGDAVEIAGRILTKFKGTVSVKGLAWELGMAEGSGTLFAKVAAMRDFGLIEGRGELRVSPLAQRVLHPATAAEGLEARAEAFQRVDLLRQLYARFEGEVPDDMSMLVGLEEITHSARDEIVRRAPLLLKHLTDAIRVLGRPVAEIKPEHSVRKQNVIAEGPVTTAPGSA
ncbi:MAG: transporter substrate-binding domain-containing protein, partial [Proteobacteria bacterium]|nr:transporter substrate-binding domain-containing protein [Pseudomonadota bacterium]